MKNLFLSVLLLLTVSFAFANNEVEKNSAFDVEKTISSIENLNSIDGIEFSWNSNSMDKPTGTCTLTFHHYNQDGEYLGSNSYSFESSYTACLAYARLFQR